jgi:formylmethanofuran dehydrogenase subunit A
MARRVDTYLSERFGSGLDSFGVPIEAFPGRDVFRIEPCLT